MDHFFNLTNRKPQNKRKNPDNVSSSAPLKVNDAMFEPPTRRRTIQREDIIGSQPTTSKGTIKISKESKLNHHQDDPELMNLYNEGWEVERAKLIEEKDVSMRRAQLLQERLEKTIANFKELSGMKYVQQELFNKSREIQIQQDEAYLNLQKSIQEFQFLRTPGGNGQQALAESLQQENQTLQQENQALKEKLKESENQQKVSNGSELYKGLTGLVITNTKDMDEDKIKQTDAGKLYTCEMANVIGSYQFSLLIPTDESKRIVYTPVIDKEQQKLLGEVPYLLEEIDFSFKDLSVFFWRLSKAMHV